VDAKGIPQFLEVNTIPGMTETSLVPKAAEYAGISFDKLVENMLESCRLKITS
jgi:D-alanine-D-alanine ligase